MRIRFIGGGNPLNGAWLPERKQNVSRLQHRRAVRRLRPERGAQHAYSPAAVCGGLDASARIAEARGRRNLGEAWRDASRRVREAIIAHLRDDRVQEKL